ncbi:MAG: hypothetical protein WC570_04195 [Patescibacteria group bacterium]
MKKTRKVILASLVLIMLVVCGCDNGQLTSTSNEEDIASSISTTPPPPFFDAANVGYESNGDLISGWHWVRNSGLDDYAEWTVTNVPTGLTEITVAMEVLATDMVNGGPGNEADFLLSYCDNTTTTQRGEYTGDEAKTPPPAGQCSQVVHLANTSPASDPVGYTCLGSVTIPGTAVGDDGVLVLRATRLSETDNHVAFRKESIANLTSGQTGGNGDSNELNDEQTGNEQFVNPDDDNDLVPNNNETLGGTDPQDPDTDDDGIIDGKDLSSLINPVEPLWNDRQKKGMVRIEQPALAYGLDGWADVFERYVTFWPPSTWMKKIAYHEDDGTKKSIMDADHYKKSLNKIFNEEKFTCYQIDDKSKTDFASGTDEMWHDFGPEFSLIYAEGFFTPKRYEFYYDYLSDYQLAYLKNTEEIKYPSETEYFKYLLYPVKTFTGKEQTVALQFKDSQMYSDLYDNGDNDYKLPAFLYTFYNNNNFDDDAGNIAYHKDNLALVSLNDNNTFEVRFTLPADKANYEDSYLKVTPVWAIKKNSKMEYQPMNVAWDLTAITREVTILKSDNNSTTITIEHSNFDGLNSTLYDVNWIKNKQGAADYQSRTETMQMLTKDPSAPENERYNDLEVSITATNYVEKTMGVAGNVYSVIEAVTIKSNKIKEITDLPTTHWARSANYTGPIAIFAAAQGVASVATNGQQAWTAYKNGEQMDVAYYSTKAALGGTNAVANVVKVTENTVGYAGKAGRLAKLTTKKAGVILAVATGTVEASYNIYKYNSTNDNILKSAYAENAAANVMDTGLSVAAVFSPHVLAVQATWMVEIEIYGLIFGEDFAYQVAKSPGQAVVFLGEYIFTGDVPSQMSKTAYNDARDHIIDWIETDNAVVLPYMSFFVDPDIS